jgi:HEAT repeat protein
MWKRCLVIALLVAVAVLSVVMVRRWQRVRLEARLGDEDPAVRAAAIRALPLDGNEELIIKMLQDEDADVRLVAVAALARPYGERPDVPGTRRAQALVGALRDPHLGVRRSAVWSLSSLGRKAWPTIREALQDKDPLVRAWAARALGGYSPHEEPPPSREEKQELIRLLLPLTRDPDPNVRDSADETLKDLSPRFADGEPWRW